MDDEWERGGAEVTLEIETVQLRDLGHGVKNYLGGRTNEIWQLTG